MRRALRAGAAGFDLRAVLEAGGTYEALDTKRQKLSFDGGLAWTREDLTEEPSCDYLGGVLGLAYGFEATDTTGTVSLVVKL